jgi:hypothetical protein
VISSNTVDGIEERTVTVELSFLIVRSVIALSRKSNLAK